MDDERALLEIQCYSEKTHDFIECGIYVSPKNPLPNEIVNKDISASLEESFWELLCDFEASAQEAFNNGLIMGTDFNDLFKVFGHFHFSCTMDDEQVNINLGIDADEYMYTLLVGYLEINEGLCSGMH